MEGTDYQWLSRAAMLHNRVAGLLWNHRPDSTGMGGWLAMESVAGLQWNGWLVWTGIRSEIVKKSREGGTVGLKGEYPPLFPRMLSREKSENPNVCTDIVEDVSRFHFIPYPFAGTWFL
jgi:hypothetical protein